MRANEAVPIWDGKAWRLRKVVNGTRCSFTSTKPDRAGYNECMRLYRSAVGGNTKNAKLYQVWPEYLEDVKDRQGKNDTYVKSESIGRLYLLPRLKNKKVYDITDQDWQLVLNKAKSVKGGQLSKKYLITIRSTIMLFCKYARKRRLIFSTPELEIPDAPTVGKQILQPEALTAFLSDDSDWYSNMWHLMLVTGLRPGEALGLHVRDVSDGMIRVRRSINVHNQITEGKNKNAQRTMKQNALAQKIILKQLLQLATNKLDTEWLFADRYGCQPTPTTVRHHWHKIRHKYGNIPQYSLRHTIISILKNDMPDPLLKALVGHGVSMDTTGVYGHQVDWDADQAADIMDKVFKKLDIKWT